VPPEQKKNACRSYALISLGCPKNLVDSERMAGLLEREGYRLRTDPAGADVAVVNTCGFIDDARAESYAVIEELLLLKQQGRLGKIVVAGCLAQRDKELLFERYPEIDQLIGVFARDDIANSLVQLGLDQQNQPQHHSLFRPAPSRPLHDGGRRRITLPHLAYLKIAEGCNRLCSFCSIPLMRGPYASKPIDEIAAEAEELAADGAGELVLVAQDTTFYGIDADGRPQLAALLRRLEKIDRLAWIRLMYLYPAHITDELMDVIASSRKILPYLDMPLQHINDEVLQRMRRRVSRDETERLLDRLREKIGSLVLRTTLLAGFPGETDAQFEELLDFVRRRRFERLGAFAFCSEPGTPAAELDGQMPEEVKQSRRDRLMAAQQEVAFAWNSSQVGKSLDVLIDRCISEEEHAYAGRSYADAPEVDGCVYVTGERLMPGQIVPCEIVAAKEYDLIGIRVEARD
jgi:ribosomal protein S12 methylthiotransferase